MEAVDAPYFLAGGDEIALFDAALDAALPVMLKGPTGCGKTRLVEHMAFRRGLKLVTVSCHEDMVASDLIGRHLLEAGGSVWQDGPLTAAARMGAICYLDEIVEARQDTIVVTHALTDDRRMLALEKRGETLRAHPDFRVVISYNPDYQGAGRELKESTRQRYACIELGWPDASREAEIVAHESGCSPGQASLLVRVGAQSRRLRSEGLAEGASTRMLIHAGRLIVRGVGVEAACRMALILPITDDPDLRAALLAALAAQL